MDERGAWPGETDLERLLAGLDSWLDPARWAFVSRPEAPPDALMTFREDEGVTAIVPAAPGAPAFRRITLRAPSSLAAVGLTAAVAGRLAAAGIAANVVAAFRRDHLFVPEDDAGRALDALRALSAEALDRAGGA